MDDQTKSMQELSADRSNEQIKPTTPELNKKKIKKKG